jgi:GNAT superfamily N-acetyltransferase
VTVRPLTKADFDRIVTSLPEFWDGRDLRPLHHALFAHEWRATSLAAERSGAFAGYLLGLIAPAGPTGYVHLVAVHADHRGRGVGRALWAAFEALAREHGAVRLKAITTPGNARSIAFHAALGMDAETVADYSGPGEDRVVFTRRII